MNDNPPVCSPENQAATESDLKELAQLIHSRLLLNQLPADPGLTSRLARYLSLLDSWNSKLDLTAVLDPEEAVDRHFIDSLSVLSTGLTDQASRIVDVGTGAGFPGLVLAMACPEKQFTLLDAQRKRLAFLETVCDATNTRNVTLLHLRAEDGGRSLELRDTFDLAVARAVAPLNVLCELVLPFVKPDGYMIAWKGPALSQEYEDGVYAAEKLGAQVKEALPYPVAGRDWDHRLLPVHKLRPTPSAYPRRSGLPKSSPLRQNRP